MINLETADAGDLLLELVRVRASLHRLHSELCAEQGREAAVYAAIEAKAHKLNDIVHSMSNQPLETAVAGARRRSAK